MAAKNIALILCLAAAIAGCYTRPGSDLRDAPGSEQTTGEPLGGFAVRLDETRVPAPPAPRRQELSAKKSGVPGLPDDLIGQLGIPVPTELEPAGEKEKASECGEEKRLFAEGLKKLLPEEEIYRRLSSRSPDVWLIGENHSFDISFQAKVIRKIKAADPRVDCVFQEYLPGSEKYWKLDETGRGEWYWPVAQAVRELGLNIVAVDPYKLAYTPDSAKRYGPKKVAYNVYVRSKGMADEIEKSFISGQCHAGVYIVGKGHQYSAWGGLRITPIQDFLRELHRKPVSVNLVITNFVDKNGVTLGDEFTVFKDSCRPPMPAQLGDPAGFVHGPMPARAHLYDDGGLMNDFDATIFR